MASGHACLEGRSVENGRIGLLGRRKSVHAEIGSFVQQRPVGFYLEVLVDRNRTCTTNTALVLIVSPPHFAFTPTSVPDDVPPVGKSRISIVTLAARRIPARPASYYQGLYTSVPSTKIPETLLSTPISRTHLARATDTRTPRPGPCYPVSRTAWPSASHPQRCPKSALDLAAPGT